MNSYIFPPSEPASVPVRESVTKSADHSPLASSLPRLDYLAFTKTQLPQLPHLPQVTL